jgi:hypothetical protein
MNDAFNISFIIETYWHKICDDDKRGYCAIVTTLMSNFRFIVVF